MVDDDFLIYFTIPLMNKSMIAFAGLVFKQCCIELKNALIEKKDIDTREKRTADGH